MAQYASPGVYVEEVASATKPIAGVSTSTAGFIGILPESYQIPSAFAKTALFQANGEKTAFDLVSYPVLTAKEQDKDPYTIIVEGRRPAADTNITSQAPQARLNVWVMPEASDAVTADYAGVAKEEIWAKKDVPSDKVLRLSKISAGEVVMDGSVTVSDGSTALMADGFTFDPKTNKVTLTSTPGAKAVTVDYQVKGTNVPLGNYGDGTLSLPDAVNNDKVTAVRINGWGDQGTTTKTVPFETPADKSKIKVTATKLPAPLGTRIIAQYTIGPLTTQSALSAGKTATIPLEFPVLMESDKIDVRLTDATNNVSVIEYDALQIQNDLIHRASALTIYNPPKTGNVVINYRVLPKQSPTVAPGEPVRCTSFSDYKKAFGDFSSDENQRNLTHAVYGFFNNGGTTCYVTYLSKNNSGDDLDKAIDAFERISDISIVVAPGIGADKDDIRQSIVAHCAKMGDRFAIFDGPTPDTAGADDIGKLTKIKANDGFMPQSTTYAAWYYPWIKVVDPVTKMLSPDTDGTIYVPPSGHIAGVFARVDNTRGVHKAPANEPIYGALDVAHRLSNTEQGALNPKGVNCIRVLNNAIMIWGARTVGGDANADLKYVNVRRTLLYLRKSIFEGTQWVVFEPNTPALWQQITRNVNAFLTNVWRSGALFGTTPQEAFYVKCDAETNPPELRDLGQVVTEIGVAIARPAEFVIFRISQWSGPGQ